MDWIKTCRIISKPNPSSISSLSFIHPTIHSCIEEKCNPHTIRDVVHSTGLYHGSVDLLIFNSKKELLIQKRSSSKDVCPSLWDVSVRNKRLLVWEFFKISGSHIWARVWLIGSVFISYRRGSIDIFRTCYKICFVPEDKILLAKDSSVSIAIVAGGRASQTWRKFWTRSTKGNERRAEYRWSKQRARVHPGKPYLLL